MSVLLKKGQKISLIKADPYLKDVIIELGWNIDSTNMIDLDASTFLLTESGKVQNENDLIFYNNPVGAQGAVVYNENNQNKFNNIDNRQTKIELSKLPNYIQRIAFTLTIHQANARRQNFGQVQNAYIKIFNGQTNKELFRYELGKDFSVETAIVIAEIYRYNNEWKFNAIGSGFQGGLAALCNNFGIQVQEDKVKTSTQSIMPSNQSYISPQQMQNITPAPDMNMSYNNNNNNNLSYNNNNSLSYNNNNNLSYNNNNNLSYNNNNNLSYNNNNLSYNNNHMNSQHNIICPRCNSNNVTNEKKGFGIGKSAIGGVLLGPLGMLGGFIGKDDLVFNCNSCGTKWSIEQDKYKNIINDQKKKVLELLNKYKSKDLLDPIVASFALISMADGRLDNREKQKIAEFINQNETLRFFDINTIMSRFNYFVSRIKQDPIMGKAEAIRTLSFIRGNIELSVLIVNYCVAVGYSDGALDQNEKQVLIEICNQLNLNPYDFSY
ncbi:MAG: TerD family protein [Tepidibacter sp.]|jgi:tellurium resistance protein TerD|uniref:TerD family protein n=1 Tax=Tepidibacter sp. TaxID=2529387 RepID=UPI0025EB05F1|nr:TerD family protein [Tepidibacter sp.]MCT4508819.1 TerD family protein [Tepidibacter sp.]